MRIGTSASIGRLQCRDCGALFIQNHQFFHTAMTTPNQFFSVTILLAVGKRVLAAATDVTVKRLICNARNNILTHPQQQPTHVAAPSEATILGRTYKCLPDTLHKCDIIAVCTVLLQTKMASNICESCIQNYISLLSCSLLITVL